MWLCCAWARLVVCALGVIYFKGQWECCFYFCANLIVLQGGADTSWCALHFFEHELLTREWRPTGGSETILSIRALEYRDQKESSWGRMGQRTQSTLDKGYCILMENFASLLAQRAGNAYLVICLSGDPLPWEGLEAQLGLLIWKAACFQETIIFGLCSLCSYSLIF